MIKDPSKKVWSINYVNQILLTVFAIEKLRILAKSEISLHVLSNLWTKPRSVLIKSEFLTHLSIEKQNL